MALHEPHTTLSTRALSLNQMASPLLEGDIPESLNGPVPHQILPFTEVTKVLTPAEPQVWI
jgi:hypothetical protein